MKIWEQNFDDELKFKAVRSSGAGGQNVNKVATKVELSFDVLNSSILTEEQQNLLLEKAAAKINTEGWLKMSSQTARTQLSNKENVRKKFHKLLEKVFTKKKKRIPTKVSAATKEKRLADKKLQSQKKELRSKTKV
ncbi:MAG: alternative ribosome rescue aminoacyl-tRNA hydrolase ArfB [Bacteroidota bacterium]